MDFWKTKKMGQRHALKGMSVFLCIILLFASLTVGASAEGSDVKLCVGGFAFGVRFGIDGILVTGTQSISSGGKAADPAAEAGIKVKDMIKKVNDKEVFTAREISEAVNQSGGSQMKLTVLRDGKEIDLQITPVKEDVSGAYRIGIDLKDSMAGIGTVTYVDPETLEFGGLGHAICDPQTATVLPIRHGSAIAVEIGGVIKGKSGVPGEIKGYFLSKRIGSVKENSECGVFGVFSSAPQLSEPISVADRSEVSEGKATILTTLGDDGIKEYEIEISKINKDSKDNKSFVIKVTDNTLKERTGGIVQGMSGSPIIQNGKLVGAVTHVMVNDPTVGYGIFIENMLNAANIPVAKVS